MPFFSSFFFTFFNHLATENTLHTLNVSLSLSRLQQTNGHVSKVSPPPVVHLATRPARLQRCFAEGL